jgi:hypothetical protein
MADYQTLLGLALNLGGATLPECGVAAQPVNPHTPIHRPVPRGRVGGSRDGTASNVPESVPAAGPEPSQNHPTPPKITKKNPSASQRLTEGFSREVTIRSPMLCPTKLQARAYKLIRYAFRGALF